MQCAPSEEPFARPCCSVCMAIISQFAVFRIHIPCSPRDDPNHPDGVHHGRKRLLDLGEGLIGHHLEVSFQRLTSEESNKHLLVWPTSPITSRNLTFSVASTYILDSSLNAKLNWEYTGASILRITSTCNCSISNQFKPFTSRML